MTHIIPTIRNFLFSEDGPEDGPLAVEYVVMQAMLLMACLTLVTSIGQTTGGTFSEVKSTVGS
jgi:pilus assembly protein Flp/PilA